MKQTVADERILVVDDEVTCLHVIDKALVKEGYLVKSTSSPKDALKIVREERFDLLLTDIMMPDINGVELLRIVRGIQPDITIAVITGHAAPDTIISCLREGVQAFITKPFTAQELKTELKRVLEKRRLNDGKVDDNSFQMGLLREG